VTDEGRQDEKDLSGEAMFHDLIKQQVILSKLMQIRCSDDEFPTGNRAAKFLVKLWAHEYIEWHINIGLGSDVGT
jgi:hypothetical protein